MNIDSSINIKKLAVRNFDCSNSGGIKKSQKSKGKLSIGTFNVTGVNGKFSENNLNYILNMLSKNPDFLVVQEVSTSNTKTYDLNLQTALKKNELRYKWNYYREFHSDSGKSGKSYQVFYNEDSVSSISNPNYLNYVKPATTTSKSKRGRICVKPQPFKMDNLDNERPPICLDVNMKDESVYNLITWHAPTGVIKNGNSYAMALSAHENISNNYLRAPARPTFIAMDANAVQSDLKPFYKPFQSRQHQHLDMITATKGWNAISFLNQDVLGKSKSNGHNGMIVDFEEN